MKTRDFVDLIKYHYTNNNPAFDRKMDEIIFPLEKINKELFQELKKFKLMNSNISKNSLAKEENEQEFFIPESIENEIKIIFNSFKRSLTDDLAIKRILFYGSPGTGKTSLARKISKSSGRSTHELSFSSVVSYKLGETIKNLERFFSNVNSGEIIIIDEIDELITNRVKSDMDEMKRVITSFNKMIDENQDIFIIATTNMEKIIDSSTERRFDLMVNFNTYDKSTLIDITQY
jgi:SpoVK/Ycf46/Vps4 family AAA+-type ATPase